MSFCVSQTDSINSGNYANSFDPSKSVLPNGGTGFSGVAADTVVPEAALSSHVATLISREQAQVPSAVSANPNPAELFTNKAAALRLKINDEYCFYYRRYVYALNSVLTLAASASSLAGNSNYETLKQNTLEINKKMNQLIQITQGLTAARMNSLKSYYGSGADGLNAMNERLNRTRQELIKQSELLSKTELEYEAKKAMMEYTLEKNSSSRNLLSVYVFMNIVAGGLLYYLYKSSQSA